MTRSKRVPARATVAWLATIAAMLACEASAAGIVCASYEYHPNLTRAVQKALVDNGARGIAVDGKWGPKSREALRRFQLSKGLEASGEVDEPTFRALFGPEVPYEGVTVRRNPHGASGDDYRAMCPEDSP